VFIFYRIRYVPVIRAVPETAATRVTGRA
jgi:hypothetical protein